MHRLRSARPAAPGCLAGYRPEGAYLRRVFPDGREQSRLLAEQLRFFLEGVLGGLQSAQHREVDDAVVYAVDKVVSGSAYISKIRGDDGRITAHANAYRQLLEALRDDALDLEALADRKLLSADDFDTTSNAHGEGGA